MRKRGRPSKSDKIANFKIDYSFDQNLPHYQSNCFQLQDVLKILFSNKLSYETAKSYFLPIYKYNQQGIIYFAKQPGKKNSWQDHWIGLDLINVYEIYLYFLMQKTNWHISNILPLIQAIDWDTHTQTWQVKEFKYPYYSIRFRTASYRKYITRKVKLYLKTKPQSTIKFRRNNTQSHDKAQDFLQIKFNPRINHTPQSRYFHQADTIFNSPKPNFYVFYSANQICHILHDQMSETYTHKAEIWRWVSQNFFKADFPKVKLELVYPNYKNNVTKMTDTMIYSRTNIYEMSLILKLKREGVPHCKIKQILKVCDWKSETSVYKDSFMDIIVHVSDIKRNVNRRLKAWLAHEYGFTDPKRLNQIYITNR